MIKSVEMILPTNSTDFTKVLEHDTIGIERTGRIPTEIGSLQLLRAVDVGNGRTEINAFYFTAAEPGIRGTGEEFTKIPGFAFETLPLGEERLRVEAICYQSALEKYFDNLLTYIKSLWPEVRDSRVNQSLIAKLDNPKDFLRYLQGDLNILRERAAKQGNDVTLKLCNQIRDYEEAIKLTNKAISGELSKTDLEYGLKPLNLSIWE